MSSSDTKYAQEIKKEESIPLLKFKNYYSHFADLSYSTMRWFPKEKTKCSCVLTIYN